MRLGNAECFSTSGAVNVVDFLREKVLSLLK